MPESESLGDHHRNETAAYIPFKSLPKEKFKRLIPYLQYDGDDVSAWGVPELPRYEPHKVGRLVQLFPQIGGAFLLGFAGGGAAGIVKGLIQMDYSKKIRRTMILNHFLKHGRSTANLLGSIAMMYCSLGVLCQLVRRKGKDDGWNSIVAGGSTGFLYQSPQGLRKAVAGGGIGLALSSLHVLVGQIVNK